MKSSSRFSVPVLWLILFCPGAAWIGWQDGVANYERFFQDTSIAQRMLSQKTVQHEAVLATLAALANPPAPERLLPSLQPSMPQLQGLGLFRGHAEIEGKFTHFVRNSLILRHFLNHARLA